METTKTEEQKEIELLKGLEEKNNYFVIPNKYSTYDDKTKSKIVKKHTIEETSKLLDNDDLYVERNFKTGTSFDYRKALIYLLLQEVIFINDYERTLENGEIIKHSSLLLNSSDIFAWGYSDAEEITTEDIKEIYDYVVKDTKFGFKLPLRERRGFLTE